ncbi:tetratricopeptide repeat protein [Actinoplanes flavus]|uniref:Tetratricopeptide repeat protein n=1 Tax=Actinoplanes flavus TaxID=2820290 RepID=A0ABS3UH42_9ACTN|nr:tetratricopeptide repeat protein [Actinoplanes flavus]MBO3738109.1 tetratricopeptide repeat protein [Actinoplanes flavus]
MSAHTQRWPSRISDLVRTVHEGLPGPRSLVLTSDAGDLTGACRDAAQQSGGMCIEIPCADGGGEPFRPLRGVIERILPIVHAEAIDLTRQLGAEIVAVHPRLAASFEITPVHTLDEIANTPSERRSHRESERSFRIVNGLARLLHGALDQCPSLKSGPIVLSWPSLHTADVGTLLAFRRLSRWANQAGSRLVLVASADPHHGPDVPEPAVPAELADCFSWREQHRRLLTGVLRQSLAETLPIEDAAPSPAERTVPAKAEPGDFQLVRRSLEAFAAGRAEEGSALAMRAMAPAAFALDYATVLLLCAHVVAVADNGEPFDQGAFDAAWQASAEAAHHPALEFAVQQPHTREELAGAAWRAAGFANSCLGSHETALRCYHQAARLARGHQQQAQALMYLGLITGKRLHRIDEAEAHIRAGIAEVTGDDVDVVGVLERCWLLNVNALMAYSGGRFKDAMRMAREAWATVRPIQSSEATHLKVNLVSNISVLYEKAGQPAEAVKVWEKFRALLGRANALFAKHYHFREAGLRLAAGQLDEALEAYQASFDQCEATTDPFHAQIVAEACAHVEFKKGAVAEAISWYERAVDAAWTVGDHERLPSMQATLAGLVDGSGSLDAVPPTKLNRPFDLVNVAN